MPLLTQGRSTVAVSLLPLHKLLHRDSTFIQGAIRLFRLQQPFGQSCGVAKRMQLCGNDGPHNECVAEEVVYRCSLEA